MSTIKDLERLKSKAESLRQERDRAQGRLEQAQKQLQEKFEVKTLEDAQELLRKLEKQEEKDKTKFDTAMKQFEEKWADELEQ